MPLAIVLWVFLKNLSEIFVLYFFDENELSSVFDAIINWWQLKYWWGSTNSNDRWKSLSRLEQTPDTVTVKMNEKFFVNVQIAIFCTFRTRFLQLMASLFTNIPKIFFMSWGMEIKIRKRLFCWTEIVNDHVGENVRLWNRAREEENGPWFIYSKRGKL